MKCYIEVYKSSFTGNILYSKRPLSECQIKQQICKTAETRDLKTIRVIKFDWHREKKGINWYPGKRRLQPVPYCYTIPPIHFLNGTVAPKKIKRMEAIKVVKIHQAEVKGRVGELFL